MTAPSTPTPSAPANRWWLPFAGMEEISFKRTPEGCVFQAPNWWLIGPRRHYLVNEAQKSKIAAQMRRMWTMVLLAIIALIAIGLPLSKSLIGDKHPIAMLGAFVLCGAMAGMMVSAYTIRRLRPIIAGLQLTTQRITQREAIMGQARIFSRARIAFFGLLSLALLALQLLNPLVFAASWSTISVVGVALFGALTIYWLAVFLAKSRADRSSA
jgi:hypothetical protein